MNFDLTGVITLLHAYDHHESFLMYGGKKVLTFFLFIRASFVTCSSLPSPCPLPPTGGCVECDPFLPRELWCGNLCRGLGINLFFLTGVSCPGAKGQDRIEGKLRGPRVVQLAVILI